MQKELKIAQELNRATPEQVDEILGISEPKELQTPMYEGSFNLAEVQALAKVSLDYLSALANPEGHIFNFPATFQAAWKLILSLIFKPRDFSKLALGLPRGFGKTAFMKLIALFIILFTDRKFIFIQAANAKLAANILADICDFLDHPNIKTVFGDWRLGLEKDTQELKKFGFRGRNIILAALGESGSPRGLNIKNARPDVMIFDDIQTKEDSQSKITSDAIYEKLLGTTMKAKAPTGCFYLFLANMYPNENSILRKLKNNPGWLKFIAGGILADGTSLWEEVQPIEQLLEEFEHDLNSGHPEIFYSEVLNDETASVNPLIDITQIPNRNQEFIDNSFISGSFIIIDPSNDKANSDLVSIGQFNIIEGKPVLCELIEERLDPGTTIRKALQLALNTGTRLIVCEGVAFQYSMLYWFNLIAAQLKLTGFYFVDIYPGKKKKTMRIVDMFKMLTSEQATILIHDKVRSQVLTQIGNFNYLKENNVDNTLDLLTYAPRVIIEHADKIHINSSELEEEEEFDDNYRCSW